MKNYLATTALAALLAAPFTTEAQNRRVVGEGPAVKESRPVSGFTKITLASSIDAEVRQGKSFSVEVEAQKNVMPNIETRLKGTELIIDIEGDVTTNKDMKVYITLPKLEGVSLAGSGDVDLEGDFKCDKLNLVLAGSGDVEGTLHATELKASLAGSGDVKLQGAAEKATVSGAGSGDFNGVDFESKDWHLNLAGSGDAKVKATGTLNVSLAGSGDVKYAGNPTNVKVSSVGSGEVSKL